MVEVFTDQAEMPAWNPNASPSTFTSILLDQSKPIAARVRALFALRNLPGEEPQRALIKGTPLMRESRNGVA